MDPDCPQLQVAEIKKLTAELLKNKTSMGEKGQRYPGRTLFGTTLDSKGINKELPEEELPFDKSKGAQPCHQLVPPLVQDEGNLCRTEPVGTTKPAQWSCLDSERAMSPEAAKKASGIKHDTEAGLAKASKSKPKRPHKTVPLSPDGGIAEKQNGSEKSPGPSTQREMTESVRSPLCVTPERLPSREDECIIPKNIVHKFGSSVVDDLLTDTEVRKFLNQKELPSKSSDYEESTVSTQENAIDHVNSYESIGYPLRCNIFPGYSGEWQSEAQSTYTKEVHHRFKQDLQHWHGKTTDELGHWVEMNIVHQKMKKALGELEKRADNA
ncbi:uncharacterized protein [Heptranchias perlo]|uniref:uncharacterized protein n=1 Tax=Heptranchias perlo TaxID=212740 RepID=UPI00355A4FE2